MNTTAKWLVLGLAAAAMVGTTEPVKASPVVERTFTIHIRNYAGVDSKVLAQAEQMTTRIFQQVGIISQWSEVDSSRHESFGATDSQPITLSDIRVNILPASMYGRLKVAPGVAGLAPGRGQDRVVAYVFYNRVVEMQHMQMAAFMQDAAKFPSTLADLLGSAIAHEVGHILLNLEGHSSIGIMRGEWDLSVLDQIAGARLHFTKDQGNIMQAEVARRACRQAALSADAAAGDDAPSLR